MIIRRDHIVVGMLDDRSLKLTEASAEVEALVEGLRKEGMFRLGSLDRELEVGEASADVGIIVPFTAENLAFIEMDLIAAGYDVQRA